MSQVALDVGYVPLLDAGPLVIAREIGFAAEEGLELRAAPRALLVGAARPAALGQPTTPRTCSRRCRWR